MDQIHVFNKIRNITKPGDRMKTYEAVGEQAMLCGCGWIEPFRVWPEGEIASTVEKHQEECPL